MPVTRSKVLGLENQVSSKEIVADDVIVRESVKTEEFRLGSNLRFYESELDNDSISIRGEIWKPLSEELSS
jgi:hypothetical protein